MSKEINEMEVRERNLPTKEEVLENEEALLAGLLKAANYKEDPALQKKIQIKRGDGPALFEFTIRPLSEEEIQECRQKVTKRKPDPRGRQFGMIDVETDYVKLRSYKILYATIDKGQGVIWRNKRLKEKLGVLQAVDVIDEILLGGEKDWINDVIDEISGYGAGDVTDEEIAKN